DLPDQTPHLHRPHRLGHRRRRPPTHRIHPGHLGVLPRRRRTPPQRPPHPGHHQPGTARLGQGIRRPRRRFRHLGPTHTSGRRLHHQWPILATPRAPSPHHRRHPRRKEITSDPEEP